MRPAQGRQEWKGWAGFAVAKKPDAMEAPSTSVSLSVAVLYGTGLTTLRLTVIHSRKVTHITKNHRVLEDACVFLLGPLPHSFPCSLQVQVTTWLISRHWEVDRNSITSRAEA